MVTLLIISLIILEDPRKEEGLKMALLGGLIFDLFSPLPFGFYTLLMLLLALGVKFVLRNYVRLPIFQRI